MQSTVLTISGISEVVTYSNKRSHGSKGTEPSPAIRTEDDEELSLKTHLDKHFIPRKKELKGNERRDRQTTTCTTYHEF